MVLIVYKLNVILMFQYMNAIKATLSTSQPVITEEEFNTIFYKISELHELHKNFLEGLKAAVASWEEPLSVGIHFKKMVKYSYKMVRNINFTKVWIIPYQFINILLLNLRIVIKEWRLHPPNLSEVD